MAKVWFANGKLLAAYDLPFAQAVEVLGVTKADHVWSPGDKSWPPNADELTFGVGRKTCVETTDDQLPGWVAGVYWAKRVEPRRADEILNRSPAHSIHLI